MAKWMDYNISSDSKQNQSLSISYCLALLVRRGHFELVDDLFQLIFPWIFIFFMCCFHVFHDEAKRTQLGDLLPSYWTGSLLVCFQEGSTWQCDHVWSDKVQLP